MTNAAGSTNYEGKMKEASKVICSVFLMTLLAILSGAFPVAVAGMPVLPIAHGGQVQLGKAYYGTVLPTLDYDCDWVLLTNEKKSGVTGDRGILPKLAEFLAAKTGATAEQGGLNLFKWNHPTSTTAAGWKEGDYFLHLPNQGSAQANWIQNSSRLRAEMGKGNPIFDSFRDSATGQQLPTRGFLKAERNLLENNAWKYNPQTGAYHPPGGN